MQERFGTIPVEKVKSRQLLCTKRKGMKERDRLKIQGMNHVANTSGAYRAI